MYNKLHNKTELQRVIEQMRTEKTIHDHVVTYAETSFGLSSYENIAKLSVDDVTEISKTMRQNGLTAGASFFRRCIAAKCSMGLPREAKHILEVMSEMHKPELVSFNLLLEAFNRSNDFFETLNTFGLMKTRQINPDEITYAALLKAFLAINKHDAAMQLYSKLVRKKETISALLYVRFIQIACASKKLELVVELYTAFKNSSKRSNTQISSKHYNWLIHSVGKLEPSLASMIFDDMLASGLSPEIDSYNALIKAYNDKGRIEAIALYEEAISLGLTPDKYTHPGYIKALKLAGRKVDAFQVYQRLAQSNDSILTIHTYNAVLDLFQDKVLPLEDVYKVWAEMEQAGCKPTDVTYHTMMLVHLNRNLPHKAYEYYQQMLQAQIITSVQTSKLLVRIQAKMKRQEEK